MAKLILLMFLGYSIASVLGQGTTSAVIQFEPQEFNNFIEGQTRTVLWYTNTSAQVDRVEAIVISSGPRTVSEVETVGDLMTVIDIQDVPDDINTTLIEGDVTYYGEVNVSALFVGLADLEIKLYDQDNITLVNGKFPIAVILASQKLTTIFTYVIAVLVAILYFFMGATLDLEIVKGIVKKPIGPVLGAICQYGVMPAVAFCLGLLFFPDELELRLGLFLNGCSPGGGASNMWTHLLDGSLDLSIMMTTVSTLLSFATVPLWVLTLGPVILASGNFVIPFGDIIITVVSLIFPCVVGIALQYFFPKVIPYCKKVLSPFSIFILVFIFTVGVYAYRYTFSIITWKSILAGLLLPLLGYILGLILAGIFRQSWKKCIAISIETGVQNTTIAVIILNVAIPPPVSNIATVVPVSNTLFTPVPLIIAIIIKIIYEKITGKSAKDTTDVKEITQSESSMVPVANGKKPADSALDAHFVSGSVEGGIVNLAADLRDDVL